MTRPQAAGVARFLWLFPLWLVVGFGLLETHYGRPAVDAWTRWLVQASALAVRIAGGSAAAHGNLLQNPSTGFSIAVEDTCNASNVVVLLCAAVLAFPATWMKKLKGIAAGTTALLAINLLRIVSLFYLGQYDPAWFEFAHLYLWEGLMMIVTLVLFWMWV